MLKTKHKESPEKEANRTGIPAQLKQEFEQKSKLSFNDVRVHYNSNKPAQLEALAFTQGSDIHIAPGQERHLPHELGHVVQQKMGLVRPTEMIGGFAVNSDPAMERSADAIASAAPPAVQMMPEPLEDEDAVQMMPAPLEDEEEML